MGGYIVKYPQSLTGIILMYDSPLCWIGNVTEINQTFPNIPVPKEYVSIYCDLQANNPLLFYLNSHPKTLDLLLFGRRLVAPPNKQKASCSMFEDF